MKEQEYEAIELGPLQKAWIKSLREHPERQTTGVLGKGDKDDYQACCLGELYMVACRLNNTEPVFVNRLLVEGKSPFSSKAFLRETFSDYGLISNDGRILSDIGIPFNNRRFYSLAEMNDNKMPWPEIADFIENNPELVFNKSI